MLLSRTRFQIQSCAAKCKKAGTQTRPALTPPVDFEIYRRMIFVRVSTPIPISAVPKTPIVAGSGAPVNGLGGVESVPLPLMLVFAADCVNWSVRLAGAGSKKFVESAKVPRK
jgi:hypothetical protein